jgi:hypothetical protein
MSPTVFNMPGALPNNQVTFDASFDNSLTTSGTVTFHIAPVSATGCIGPEVTQVVTIYGNLEVAPDPLGVCIGSTGTMFGNPAGGSGTYTYKWVIKGGTARNFRVNGTTVSNPNTDVDSLYFVEDLAFNATLADYAGRYCSFGIHHHRQQRLRI